MRRRRPRRNHSPPGDLLSTQASHGSISDFLPGASVISGVSQQSASASGMMDPTPAVGASFAAFTDIGSAQEAVPTLLANS